MCAFKMTGSSGRGKGNSLLGKACSKSGRREESRDRIKTNPVFLCNMDRWPWEPCFVQLFFHFVEICFFFFNIFTSILNYADLLNCYIYPFSIIAV